MMQESEDLFFSVDCETSGPFPGRHALLSVGAVAVARSGESWTLGASHYAEWAPPKDAEEDAKAREIHGLDFAELRARGIDALRGAQDLAAWVRGFNGRRRVFVGYNAGFDWAFVLHALGRAGVENPFHHAPLDLKSAIWGAHGDSWREGSTLHALEQLVGRTFAPEPGERQHNALDDARLQGRALIAILEHLAPTRR